MQSNRLAVLLHDHDHATVSIGNECQLSESLLALVSLFISGYFILALVLILHLTVDDVDLGRVQLFIDETV